MFQRATKRARILLTDNIYGTGAAVVSTITSISNVSGCAMFECFRGFNPWNDGCVKLLEMSNLKILDKCLFFFISLEFCFK